MSNLENMRIGYVVKRYPRYSETFIVNEILAHEAAGVDIEIFSLYPSLDTHFQDILAQVRAPVYYLPNRKVSTHDFWQALETASQVLPNLWADLEQAQGEHSSDIYQAVGLAQAVREKKLQSLHAHFGTASASVARLASHFAKVPFTFTAHAKDIFHESVDPQDLRKKIRDAAAVVTVSDFNVDYLSKHFDAPETKVTRIYNGLDLERFRFKMERINTRRIIAVGRLVEKKGFIDLVEACGILSQRMPNFKCQIIGEGPEEARLRSRIEALNLQDFVEVSIPLPQKEIIRRLECATALAGPFVVGEDGNRDGLPTVLLEAMALGVPCIATDVTGVPEVLRHGETGLMVPQHDPRALAASLEALIADEALQRRLAKNAREMIEKNFDIHVNTKRMREVFATLKKGKIELIKKVS